jgi:ribonucleoside-diphosphate reductase alpha chain
VLSLPDGIALVLAEHLGQGRVEDAEPPAAPAAKLVAGDMCPECGQATFVYEEGCKKCYGCGFNEC